MKNQDHEAKPLNKNDSNITSSFTSVEPKDISESKNVQWFLTQIKDTINELDKSLIETHSSEKMIFQNELQLMIDKHRLDFELEREKCKNERLKRMNYEDGNHRISNFNTKNEIKHWRDKCNELIKVVKKRTNQICKAVDQVNDLKTENNLLKHRLKEKDEKIQDLLFNYDLFSKEMNEKVKKLEKEILFEKQKYNERNLLVALQEQTKQNRQLMFNNWQLKNQIVQRKTIDKYNVSTQMNEQLFEAANYSNDFSG